MMNSFVFCVVLFLVSLTSAGTEFSLARTKWSLLWAHNKARQAVQKANTVRAKSGWQPRAKYMANLIWDDGLAKNALQWAKQCRFGHSARSTSSLRSYGTKISNPRGVAGENIYYTTATPTDTIARNSANDWVAESQDWQYSTSGGSCRSGKKCGHYTQVVWANTKYVGCGMANCARTPAGGKYKTVTVCQYYPPGNYRGQAPYTRADDTPVLDFQPDEMQPDEFIPDEPQPAAVNLDYFIYALLGLVAINVAILVASSSNKCRSKSSSKTLGYGVVGTSETEEINV